MMAAKITCLVACCAFHVALSVNYRKPPAALTSVKKALSVNDFKPSAALASVKKAIAVSVSDMKEVFVRSEQAHDNSMARISAEMLTMPQALEALQNSSYFGNSSELKEVAQEVTNLIDGDHAKKSLRAGSKQPDDYGSGGIASAKKLLNEMIYEAMAAYDQEVAKCTSYYSKQCNLMEGCRSSIAASNYVAANSRALILDAQGNINICEKSIPELKLELKTHNAKCSADIQKMNEHLKVVMGDIAVMTMILKMTDCETQFVQMEKMAMLRCRNNCTQKDFVVFNQTKLQKQVSSLQSTAAKVLIRDSFTDMFDDAGPEVTVEFAQVNGFGFFFQQAATTPAPPTAEPNKTSFNNPPVPRTQVPGNPCNDPNFGAPSADDKRAAKCTIKKSPQCYKLQSRFLMIQGGIQDERDQLMEDVEKLEESCKETKRTIDQTIAGDEDLLSTSQTKLAQATEKEATAAEKARQTGKEHEQLNQDLLDQMKKCSDHYIESETELCALKKIRGELYKMKSSSASGFFQDCEVSKWTPEACSKECAGGVQKLTRSVLTHPNGGAKCLPLAASTSCNQIPCPVDCVLGMWSGFSKCSADCGGGVTQRLREVKIAPRNDGKPCSASSESKACNVAACEKDCELGEWTKWTQCSKDCDGGTRKRQRFIGKAAQGSGKCAGEWDPDRLQYMECNVKRCYANMKCDRTQDYVLMLDACPKTGEDGWAAEVKAALGFIESLRGVGVTARPNVAIIHYCGPRTWSGVSKCTGKSGQEVDLEKDCKIKVAHHFSTDLSKAKSVITGLQYTPGEKLLSLALLAAKAELSLGDKHSPSNVIVFIDGMPLSQRQSHQAASAVRKAARLLFVAVTKFAPLKNIKTWATRRWEENVVSVDSVAKLANPEVVTHIIANLCPSEPANIAYGRTKR